VTSGSFGVAEPWELDPVNVAKPIEVVNDGNIDIEVVEPVEHKLVPVAIKVSSDSSSSSSSSESEGEGKPKREKKDKKDDKDKKHAGDKDKKHGGEKAASSASIPPSSKDKPKEKEVDKDKAVKDKEKAVKEQQEKDKQGKDKAAKDKAVKDKQDQDKAAKDKADKEKVDKDKKEKDQQEKDKATKDKQDKDKAAKDQQEKDKATKDKEKVAKDLQDKEKAAKEKADKDKATKDKQDKEKADKEKEKADKEKAEKDKKDHEKKVKEEKDKAEKDKKDQEKKEIADKEKKDQEKKGKEKGQQKPVKEKPDDEKVKKEKDDAKKPKEKSDKEKEKDKADKERRVKDLAKLGPLPSATFDKGFSGALYGKLDLDNFVHEAPATSLYSATTNLTFDISAHDGVLQIGPSQGNAWHVRVVPVGLTWHSESARLFKGSAFVSVRSEGVEIGAQVREDSSSQFFVLAKGVPLTLRFETSGIGEIKHDEKDGETIFSDVNGNALFIYSTPALHARSKSKKLRSNITWDNHRKELRIEAVGYAESLGIVCAICTKCITLPPDEVLYSLPDGSFVVVHPKVNFYGHASAAGIAYKSLTPEVDPWSITLSLQGGKIHKVYAQSKCTVVLLRNDGIREYLAYVDRGNDYVGLHQSFHLHNQPSSYPLRIPISFTLEGITEIAQPTDSLITFSTPSGPVFAYGNLVVLDARGNTIPSQIRLEDSDSEQPSIVLEVLEEGEFPLVVG